MKTVCISPRVGVGFARIGRESDAERRSGVVAFGFDFTSAKGLLDCFSEFGGTEDLEYCRAHVGSNWKYLRGRA